MPDTIDLTVETESSSVVLDTRRTRPRFFDGKFLTAADLVQEQSYLLTRQADLGRTLGFGIVNGLRASKSTVSASGLPNPAASVKITAGHGLAPSGDLVFLPNDLIVDLPKVDQMIRLNAAFGLSRAAQQPFQNLSGLFVLGLRAVEFTANPTPAYPPSVDGNSALRDGEVIEATALVIVPYESDASRKNAHAARSRAAREIFLEQKIPTLPAGVLPLAMFWVRNGAVDWVDEWLVRREAGDDDRFGFGFAPRALSEAHFFQYQDMLAYAPTTTDGQLSAKNFLEIVPPAGPLPKGVLSQTDFTQAYFPAEARVELALVPEDELPALMEASIDLPPIDLSLKPEDQDALAILVLAPVKRADYGNALQLLQKTPVPVLKNPVAPLLSQQKPIQALLKLNAAFQLRKAISTGTTTATDTTAPDFVDPAWRDALKKSPQLWYLRRRNLPDGKGLAGTPLPVVTQTPPPDEVPTENPPGGDQGGDTPPVVEPGTRSSVEADMSLALAKEGLWGRFAFLRAISDAPTHALLSGLLTNSIVQKSPLLQHAVFTALEKELPAISESPEENFEQIQKDADIKVLTPEIIAKVGNRLVRTDVVRGLQTVTADHPKLLSDKRLRYVLGRTNRIGELADIGLRNVAGIKDVNSTKADTAARVTALKKMVADSESKEAELQKAIKSAQTKETAARKVIDTKRSTEVAAVSQDDLAALVKNRTDLEAKLKDTAASREASEADLEALAKTDSIKVVETREAALQKTLASAATKEASLRKAIDASTAKEADAQKAIGEKSTAAKLAALKKLQDSRVSSESDLAKLTETKTAQQAALDQIAAAKTAAADAEAKRSALANSVKLASDQEKDLQDKIDAAKAEEAAQQKLLDTKDTTDAAEATVTKAVADRLALEAQLKQVVDARESQESELKRLSATSTATATRTASAADVAKLMDSVEKYTSTGRAQAVADAIDKFLKQEGA